MEGWLKPRGARRKHYFRNGVSLCGDFATRAQTGFEAEPLTPEEIALVGRLEVREGDCVRCTDALSRGA